MSVLNLYPRLQLQASSVDDGGDEAAADIDRHSAFVGYCIAIAVVTTFVFCVLLKSVTVWKACAFAALAVLLLGVAGCFAFKVWSRRSRRRGTELVVTVAAAGAAQPGHACPHQVNAPPAFPFECPLVAGGGDESETPAAGPAASAVVCSVCLEDLRDGDMVRRLPACRHIFHVEYIDLWLHSHRTCPMCRCVISLVATVTPKAEAEEQEASYDHHNVSPV